MKLSELYTEYIANWLSSGLLIQRDKISLLGIRSSFDSYITNEWITKIWMITELPVHYDVNLTQAIRTEMHRKFPQVKTVVYMYNSPVKVNVNNEAFRRQFRMASGQYEKYAGLFKSLTDDEKLTGMSVPMGGGRKFNIDKATLLAHKATYDSYYYVYDTVIKGMEFTSTYYFVQASAKNRKILRKYQKALYATVKGTVSDFSAKADDIFMKEVHGSIDSYLRNYGPATYLQQKESKFNTLLLSDENKAALMPTKTKGLVW